MAATKRKASSGGAKRKSAKRKSTTKGRSAR
jgi:hypothetical protein